jgi:hypothetical protein
LVAAVGHPVDGIQVGGWIAANESDTSRCLRGDVVVIMTTVSAGIPAVASVAELPLSCVWFRAVMFIADHGGKIDEHLQRKEPVRSLKLPSPSSSCSMCVVGPLKRLLHGLSVETGGDVMANISCGYLPSELKTACHGQVVVLG